MGNSRFFRKLAALAATGLVSLFGAVGAQAGALTAYICNDQFCSGGNDLIVNDADSDGAVVIIGQPYAGFFLALNTSLSQPALAQGMDLSYSVTAGQGPGGSLWLYAVDTAMPGPASLSAHYGGTNDAGGTSLGSICVGTTANCVFSPLFGGGSFASDFGSLFAGTNPYTGIIGIQLTVATGQTASGDLRLNVPEPASLALVGLALLGLGAVRRRKNA